MASFVLRRAEIFPSGSSVSAYATAQIPANGTGEPNGALASTVTVATDGSATFTGLADGTSYVAYAPPAKYVGFRTSDAVVSDGGGVPAVPLSVVDAKGDLFAATGPDAVTRLAAGSAGQLLAVDSGTASGLDWEDPAEPDPQELVIPFSQPGTLAAGFGTAKFRLPINVEIVNVAATVGTAPAGGNVVVDLNRNGVSLWQDSPSTQPKILSGATESTEAVPPSTGVAAGDSLTIDVDSVGTDTPGANLTVTVYMTKSAIQPPPLVGFIVNDTFTGSDGTSLDVHTGEVNAGWSKHPTVSTPMVLSDANRVRNSTANATAIYMASGVPSTAEYDVTGTLYFRSIETTMRVGVIGRLDPTVATYYLARWATESGGQWELHQFVAGVDTTLGTYAQVFTAGAVPVVMLEIRNATKKVFIDGVERISSADNTITAAGRLGIRALNNSAANNQGLHIADFQVV